MRSRACNISFASVGQRASPARNAVMSALVFISTRRLYQCRECRLSGFPYRGHSVAQDSDLDSQMVLDDLYDDGSEEWGFGPTDAAPIEDR